MLEMIALSSFAVAGAVFLICKLGNIRRILYFDKYWDIGVTFFFSVILYGTYSGMMVALMGGAIFSAIFYLLKRIIGYDKPTRKGWVPASRPLDEVMK